MLGYSKYQNFVADANKILIFTHNLTWKYPRIYIHELVVRARQLVLKGIQQYIFLLFHLEELLK